MWNKVAVFILSIFLVTCSSSWGITENNYNEKYLNSIRESVNKADHESFIVNNLNTDIVIKDNQSVSKKVRKEIIVLNEQGRSESELVLFHDSFVTIDKIKASIYSLNGLKVKDLDDEDIRDIPIYQEASSFSDSRVKLVSFNYNVYPYILYYEYEESSTNFLYRLEWSPQEENGIVNKASLNLTYPKGLDINIKDLTRNFNRIEFETKKSRIINWEKPKTEKSENPEEKIEKVLIQPQDFNVESNKGSFENWKTFGLWYYKLNNGRQELSAGKKEELDQLLTKADTELEKMELIYNHLQDNSRYISVQLGIGGWQTFPASFVEKNGYGDCKALTNFSFAMYKYVGIEAYPVLINSGLDSDPLIEDFPSNQFNHVILYLPNDGDEVWLECTSQIMPFNYITSFNANRVGLKISGEGGELIKTPSFTIGSNSRHVNTKVQLDENFNASLARNITEASGEYLEKYYFGFANKTEQQKIMWLNSNFVVKADRFFDIETSSINRKENPISFTYKILTDDYFRKSGDRIFFSSFPFKEIYDYNYQVSVRHYNPFMETDSISIGVPEGYTPESVPKDVEITNEIGTYLLKYSFDEKENVFLIYRKLVLKIELEKNSERLKTFFKKVNQVDNNVVSLKKTS